MKAQLVRHEKLTDELGNTIEIKLWGISPTTDKPHGFKYSLAYVVNGKRVVGYDNSEQKGDHRHYGNKEEPYIFTNLRQLAKDFMTDIEKLKRRNK